MNKVYLNASGVHRLVLDSWKANESCCVVDGMDARATEQLKLARAYEGPPALITWTTGTTAAPKGVVIPWSAVEARCEALRGFYASIDISRTTSFFLPTHSGGLITSRLAVHYLGGNFVEPDEAEGVTFVTGTPKRIFEMVTDRLQKHPRLFERNKRTLSAMMTLHDALTQDRRSAIQAATRAPVYEMYGTSECGGVSIDGVTLPGYEIRSIRNRLEVKSAANGVSYIGAQEVFPISEDGFFRTPDEPLFSVTGKLIGVKRMQ